MTEKPVIIRRAPAAQKTLSTNFSFDDTDFFKLTKEKELEKKKKAAWEYYKKATLPTKANEAWRRTDISRLDPGSFHLPKTNDHKDMENIPEEILLPITDKDHGGQIILSGNAYKQNVTRSLQEKGVVFSTFSNTLKTHPGLLEKCFGKIVKSEEGIFPAMVQSLAEDGILLYIPENIRVDEPLHSLLWNPEQGVAYLSHVIVVLEKNATATYIHETASPESDDEAAMHAGVVEIHVGENANLQFVELQSFGKNVWNFTNERARVETGGTIEWTFGAIGSRLTKNFTDLDLAGDGATGKMSGFYFTNGNQHLDHDTQQNHLAAHTTSDLLFKGALLDKSRSVWQGMIYVAPGAQKTDGYQANRNLILSKNAHADSLPGLEILADDVRCTHGATVGKIDKDEVFYLVSRGIPQKEAERLIVEGFFDPIMQRIPFEGVRNRFEKYIHEKMAD